MHIQEYGMQYCVFADSITTAAPAEPSRASNRFDPDTLPTATLNLLDMLLGRAPTPDYPDPPLPCQPNLKRIDSNWSSVSSQASWEYASDRSVTSTLKLTDDIDARSPTPFSTPLPPCYPPPPPRAVPPFWTWKSS
jgi:hypothetical protein